jgi:hypothetical protein
MSASKNPLPAWQAELTAIIGARHGASFPKTLFVFVVHL